MNVWLEDAGLKFFVTNTMVTAPSGSGPAVAFQPPSDWMMCWDSQDWLWTDVPEQDGNYWTCWYSSPQGSGSCRVGESGGWDGILDAFFTRLPESVKTTDKTFVSLQAHSLSSQPVESSCGDTSLVWAKEFASECRPSDGMLSSV